VSISKEKYELWSQHWSIAPNSIQVPRKKLVHEVSSHFSRFLPSEIFDAIQKLNSLTLSLGLGRKVLFKHGL